ncbi:MAG: hypothetical protein WD534_18405 [Phycisphaeraceae bacterium]
MKLAMARTWMGGLLVVVSAMGLAGCSGYQLQGKVIEGPESGVFIVSEDDPRLDEPGLRGARVALTLDADRLSAKHVGDGESDLDGAFTVSVDEFGAGFLEHDVEVLVRLAGYAPAVRTIRLPGSSRRVLVTLAEGEDELSPRPGDLLDETMRMGEPYMGR